MTLLTPAETAAFLKISLRTLRRLPVPRAKIGGQLRYDVVDLEAYVLRQKQGLVIDIATTKTVVRSPALPLLAVRYNDMPPSKPGKPIRHRSPALARKQAP